MRRTIVLALLIIVCFVLQCTFCQAVSLAYIAPNLLIILISSFGFMRGRTEGLLIGFFCGLLSDIFFGQVIGLNAFIYMLIGYMNGVFNRIFYDLDIKMPMLMVFLSELAYNGIVLVTQFILRGRFQIDYYVQHVIIPEITYTLCVTLILYRIFYRINKWLEKLEKRGDSTNA